MAHLTMKNVSKKFGDITVVDDVCLEVADGEFLALLGPSGCGKTTTLRMIAGFEHVSSGSIAFDDRMVSTTSHHVTPEQRQVGIVFQSYALWPHMSVEGNVGYPLRVAKVKGAEYRRRVDSAMKTVDLIGFGDRRPADLSGGQRQRVALARCLVMEPSLVLLDEPLANLDVHLRASMESQFLEFHEKTKATMVYITHDQAEAMALADRIAVMDEGRVEQLAEPRTLYEEPATEMVANFIGHGVVVDGKVVGKERDGRCEVELLGVRVSLRCQPNQPKKNVQISLRPEDLQIADKGVKGQVQLVVYRGGVNDIDVIVTTSQQTLLRLSSKQTPEMGAPIFIDIIDGWVIPGSTIVD